MPPSPEEGRKRPFECHVHWTPLLHLLSWYDKKYVNFYCFVVSLRSILSIQGFSIGHLVCEQILLWIWPQWASLTWYISSVCGLSLCGTFASSSGSVFSCNLITLFLPASLVVGSFCSQSLLRKPTADLLRIGTCPVQTPSSLTAFITWYSQRNSVPGQHTRSKSSISAWYFLCLYLFPNSLCFPGDCQ